MPASAGSPRGQISEFWQLLALRGLTGIGEAALFVGAATLIADMSPRDRRAEGASYFSVAVFGGIGMGPIIGEALLDDTNFQRAFVVAGLFAFLAAGLALFAPACVDTDDVIDDTIASAAPATGRRRLIHPAAIMPGLVLACGVGVFSAFGAFVPDYSRRSAWPAPVLSSPSMRSSRCSCACSERPCPNGSVLVERSPSH